MKKLMIAALVSFSASMALAKAPLAAFGLPTSLLPSLPYNFTIVDWNIYKGGKNGMAADLAAITRDADVVVLQEAAETPELIKDLSHANPSMWWQMVRGFVYQGSYTGVATGARVSAINVEGFLTTVREPVLNSPKTMLLTVYPIANTMDSLAVLNVHAINFVLNSTFKKQVAQIISILKDHRGPIVVTGDFNTWNDGRMTALDRGLGSLGLRRLKLKNEEAAGNDGAYKGLDHAYVRGLVATEAARLPSIKSSDHKPILLKLRSPDSNDIPLQVAN